MQPKFRYAVGLTCAVLFAAVIVADTVIERLPDRQAKPPALATVRLEPLNLSAAGLAPLAVAGAWRLESPEQRFGGISALAVDGAELVAVTDGGAVLRFPKPAGGRMQVHVSDLPGGPGEARFKMNRDSEALLRDAGTGGWWVAFENRDELWLYDAGFRRTLARLTVPSRQLGENTGIEGLAAGPGEILAFPESGGSVRRWSGGRWSQLQTGRRRGVSDAAGIDDTHLLLLERDVTLGGFENALVLVERSGAAFRTLWRRRLPVAPRDNLEALAVEPAPGGGGYRLWIMSDDNFHPRLRTVLLAVDVPAGALPKRP